jgi:hypothetical protein
LTTAAIGSLLVLALVELVTAAAESGCAGVSAALFVVVLAEVAAGCDPPHALKKTLLTKSSSKTDFFKTAPLLTETDNGAVV